MTLPGTVIQAEKGREREVLGALFLTGGLTLAQVAELTRTEPYDIQNWVRRGFCPAPDKKKYDLPRFCRIATICFLKDALKMGEIVALLSAVNGALDDTSDDMISDDELYFSLVKALSCLVGGEFTRERLIIAIDTATTEFICTHEEDAARLRGALEALVYAYAAGHLLHHARVKMGELGIGSCDAEDEP